MTETEFRQKLKSGLAGVYFFFGEEEYLKKFYSGRALVQTVGNDPDMAAWNSYIIEGKKNKNGSANLDSLEEAVSSVAMMGDKVFVKYTADFSLMDEDETAALIEIMEKVDPEQTVLIVISPENGFNPGDLKKNRPSALYKKLEKVSQPVNFAKLTRGELVKWMARRLKSDGLLISDDAADELIGRSGTTMSALSGELDKLAAYALANSMMRIDPETVDLVCSVNEEGEAFAMANALLNGDRRGALRELHRCKTAREEPIAVLGGVSKSLSEMLSVCCLMNEGCDKATIAEKLKIHEYRTGKIMDAVKNIKPEQLIATLGRCRETDLAMKSSLPGYTALERFICTIPAGRRR